MDDSSRPFLEGGGDADDSFSISDSNAFFWSVDCIITDIQKITILEAPKL